MALTPTEDGEPVIFAWAHSSGGGLSSSSAEGSNSGNIAAADAGAGKALIEASAIAAGGADAACFAPVPDSINGSSGGGGSGATQLWAFSPTSGWEERG